MTFRANDLCEEVQEVLTMSTSRQRVFGPKIKFNFIVSDCEIHVLLITLTALVTCV